MSSPFLLSARAFAGRLVISLLLVSALTVAGVAAVNRGINERLANVKKIDLVLPPAPPEGANYVILGSDSREFVKDDPGDAIAFGDPTKQTGQRSDTLMIAHVEPAAKKTLIVSFPRDLLVDIPNHGKGKINSAFDLGGGGKDGAQLVIDTLQLNFPGLKINHYVQVDFRSFQSVVDAIGTVGVYFPLNTRDYDAGGQGDTSFEAKAGCAKLNGDSALQYVRSRHLQEQDPNTLQWNAIGADAPDIHRIERQQAFIRELAGIAISQSLSDPFTALDVADRVNQYLTSDGINRDDLNQLIRAFRTVDVNDTSALEFATVPWKVNPADPLSSLIFDQPAANDLVKRLETFGDKPPPADIIPSQVHVRVIDATGQGYENPVSESLVKEGFVSDGTGIEKFPVQTTDIRYASNVPSQVRAAKLMLDYFPDVRLVPDPLASQFIILVLGANFSGAITVPTATTTTLAPGTDAPAVTLAPTTTTAPTPTTTTLALGSAC